MRKPVQVAKSDGLWLSVAIGIGFLACLLPAVLVGDVLLPYSRDLAIFGGMFTFGFSFTSLVEWLGK